MGILIQLFGSILAVVAFLMHWYWPFIIIGLLLALLDLIALLSGKFNPLLPIFLYIGGYVATGNWTGFLWGAIIGNMLESIPILLGIGIMPFFLKTTKEAEDKNQS